MKRYRVFFDPEARDEALAAAEYIAARAPMAALRWYKGIERAIDSLRTLPNRCAVAPESEFLGVELRHDIYKSHRIIFRVDENARMVRVLHVRHGARRAIGEAE
jgi:plasmid stabilization system protein ParE